jgi:hypothetical protein
MVRFGVRPNTVTHTILVWAYRRGGQFNLAVSTFIGMREGLCLPDDVTFWELFMACDQGGLGEEAMWTLEQMEVLALELGVFPL